MSRAYVTASQLAQQWGYPTSFVLSRMKRHKIPRSSKITPQLAFKITDGALGVEEPDALVCEYLDRPALPVEYLDTVEGLAALEKESKIRQARMRGVLNEWKANPESARYRAGRARWRENAGKPSARAQRKRDQRAKLEDEMLAYMQSHTADEESLTRALMIANARNAMREEARTSA
ncbi:hypothetical protein [Tsukamurella tyrosinosolvens]|uniref:hypothetical protein n=1 Tax=Tsukamurella tyrosinosolvens TaxID=57704 RepID=UPI002DD42DFE|nr:hypothetical protein [Tsukamurella tyrosinosolvens]MEC4611823.1 hypothetical protein [Tsukamurella tyrosinosolvens]